MDENKGNNEMLKFIATTVETMRDDMATMRDQMATKSELRHLQEQMATKSELRRLEEKMEVGFTAVRGDIERVSLRLDTIERALSARLSQIETDMSRLRSVIYLLVKDQPELLRLLGTDPPLV